MTFLCIMQKQLFIRKGIKKCNAKIVFTLVKIVALELLSLETGNKDFRFAIINNYINDKRDILSRMGIMNTKKIKVIKKGAQQAAAPKVKIEKKTAQIAAREMVSNVTNWVTDFQQRRRDETKQAIEKFFSQPQTNGI